MEEQISEFLLKIGGEMYLSEVRCDNTLEELWVIRWHRGLAGYKTAGSICLSVALNVCLSCVRI